MTGLKIQSSIYYSISKISSNPHIFIFTNKTGQRGRSPTNENDDRWYYISIPLFLVCVLLGAVLGFFAFKSHYKKAYANQVADHHKYSSKI